MRFFWLLLAAGCLGACGQGLPRGSIIITATPAEQDRRFVLLDRVIPLERLAPPFRMEDQATGAAVACQWESAGDKGTIVRWLVPFLRAGEKRAYVLERGEGKKAAGMTLTDDPGGWISVRGPDREITRCHHGALADKFRKPFYYPLNARGVDILRGHPIEKKPGEAEDHPHHTGICFSHGDVNGKDYWSKVPIQHKRIVKKEAGPVYAHVTAENRWGEDLVETQDVIILNAGEDAVMEWKVVLKAENGPVVLGNTKEGTFSVRVAAGLSDPAKGPEKGKKIISDALGNKGEDAVRAQAAPWVDYSGEVGGKRVGVAVMNHPVSFRSPTTWHVRAYGLFAANPFYVAGEHKLEKGESITVRYRVYVHSGDAAEGKVADVYEGYTNSQATSD